MAAVDPSRPGSATTAAGSGGEPAGSAGWVLFASFTMVLVGTFQVVQALVTLLDDGFYQVTESGLVLDVDYAVWGWVHLGLALTVVGAGIGVLTGSVLARILGVGLAGLSALVNLVFIAAYPLWGVLVLTLDVLVIYALTVHAGRPGSA